MKKILLILTLTLLTIQGYTQANFSCYKTESSYYEESTGKWISLRTELVDDLEIVIVSNRVFINSTKSIVLDLDQSSKKKYDQDNVEGLIWNAKMNDEPFYNSTFSMLIEKGKPGAVMTILFKDKKTQAYISLMYHVRYINQ